MVKSRSTIVIDNLAKAQLKEAYKFIKLDSPKNAEKSKLKFWLLLTPSQITVIMVRHTKMEPKSH